MSKKVVLQPPDPKELTRLARGSPEGVEHVRKLVGGRRVVVWDFATEEKECDEESS